MGQFSVGDNREGAKSLAAHFSIDQNSLATAIKDQLLVLANDWMRVNEQSDRKSIWTMRAWPNLQADIQLAINWLILISGKKFEELIDEWKPPTMGNWPWAQLDKVLPYEFVRHQEKFVQTAPIYLKSFNEEKNNPRKFDEATLPELCRSLRRSNYPFAGFLAAFHEFHDHLHYRSFDKHGLDFRMIRPLDHYASVAIQAEGCLRRELDRLKLLGTIAPDKQGLARYIARLSEAKGLSGKIVNTFSTQKKLADLHTDRADPIGRIQSLQTGLANVDEQVVQAFLCCLLARNYFAHHDFLDNELMYTSKSAFLLKGIVLTVLILLS